MRTVTKIKYVKVSEENHKKIHDLKKVYQKQYDTGVWSCNDVVDEVFKQLELSNLLAGETNE